MNEEPAKIQMLLPSTCPHCGKDVMARLIMDVPKAELVDPEKIEPNINNLNEGQNDIT